MPKVFNKRAKDIPVDAVYIGRPSAWGNPFTHKTGTLAKFKVETRDEAVDKYEEWLLSNPVLVAQVQLDLRGKDLVCWCSPARCHGDVLVKVANLDLFPQLEASESVISSPVPSPFVPTGRFQRVSRQ